jgi:hypothetical protein
MIKVCNKFFHNFAITILAIAMVSCAETADTGNTITNIQVVNTDELTLGLASTFGIFGGPVGITNLGPGTIIVGDMGSSGASTVITGFHTSGRSYTETPLNIGAVTGTIYSDLPLGTITSKAIANKTLVDMETAFINLASIADGIDPNAGQLGGLTLPPGVYKSESGAFVISGGDLNLDAEGDPEAVWIFQMASSLTVGDDTTTPRNVNLLNEARSRNVYWQVGTAATINASGGGIMVGTILAGTTISISSAGKTNLSTLYGRALSLYAPVAIVNTIINVYGYDIPLPITPDPVTPHLDVSGSNAVDVATTITLGGYITVVNDGGWVAATMTGPGSMYVYNGAGAGASSTTQTGDGTMTIGTSGTPRSNTGVLTVTITGNGNTSVNDAGTGALTITNTGHGPVTVTNTATGAVTITNTGNGSVIVSADGAFSYTYTHSNDANVNIVCTLGTCL